MRGAKVGHNPLPGYVKNPFYGQGRTEPPPPPLGQNPPRTEPSPFFVQGRTEPS